MSQNCSILILQTISIIIEGISQNMPNYVTLTFNKMPFIHKEN